MEKRGELDEKFFTTLRYKQSKKRIYKNIRQLHFTQFFANIL